MKKNVIKIFLVCLITLSSWNGIAQPGTNDAFGGLESTTTDQAAAPLNDYLIPMLVVGVLFSFYIYKKKLTSIKN
ncbi:MAG: hypothetical protein K9I35_08645 [Flavobacterium sp.]|jgi:uncharacterized membrane protein|nr:hypothetical protein [Flavobacterium sp.]